MRAILQQATKEFGSQGQGMHIGQTSLCSRKDWDFSLCLACPRNHYEVVSANRKVSKFTCPDALTKAAWKHSLCAGENDSHRVVSAPWVPGTVECTDRNSLKPHLITYFSSLGRKTQVNWEYEKIRTVCLTCLDGWIMNYFLLSFWLPLVSLIYSNSKYKGEVFSDLFPTLFPILKVGE